ncbi:MAG: HEAT repeat domain-containing protein [Desulfobacterales bacterium]|nr:HEAT repeat domain-containing protein [Desulfobacterales bacterium]
MNINQLKKDIFDPDYPEKQCKAAYQMRYMQKHNKSEAVYILFSACYEAEDPRLQQEAVKSLGVLNPERALETFIKSTFNTDAEKRRRAYYHLGTLGNPQGIEAVLKGLADPDEGVRRAATISAGRLGQDHSVITALQKLLNSFEPAPVQLEAKRSIDCIKMRLIEKSKSERSFNRPSKRNENSQKSFNKSNFTPKAYTPQGF